MAQRPNQVKIRPAPPRAPATFTQDWVNELNRWLTNLSEDQAGFLYARLSGMYWPNAPTSGYGLQAGEVFANDGILTIVREDDIWAGGFEVGVELGTLTVTV
jgi:hypothetical protein